MFVGRRLSKRTAAMRSKRVRDEEDQQQQEVMDDIEPPSWFGMTRDALQLPPPPEGDEAQTPQAAVEEKEYFEPRMLPSRRREFKAHGKPGPRDTCFLCCYAGERDTLLPYDDLNKMIEMIRQNMGRMDWGAMAAMVSRHYDGFRRRINAHLEPGEQKLPKLSPATILDHIRTHHHDPQVKQIVMLDELQEARQCTLRSLFERSTRTKKTRINKTQMDALEKIVKLELTVQRSDPSKMMLFAADARVNSAIHKQGPIAAHNKSLINYWKNRR